MSVWTTKSSGITRDYIVLRHTLKGVNYTLNGIRFRNGYAVVEKNSKTYINLLRIPVLKGAKEFPLAFLRKLPFITRALDVKYIYGADVYVHYIKEITKEIQVEQQETKVQEEIKHIVEKQLCAHKINNRAGSMELCKHDALEQSPSGHCLKHILDDPKLTELGIEFPKFIVKKDKHKERLKVADKLADLKKQGKF